MPKMTVQQFGQQVKSKHPEYAGYSDEEIGNRVLQKYPQYGAQVDAQVSPSAEDVARAAGISDAPAHAPAPRELSGRPGDSTDLRVNLFGNDGSQLLKVPARHAAAAVTGIATAAMHPIKTAKAAIIDQPIEGLRQAQQAYDRGDDAAVVAAKVAGATPIVGPWAKQVFADADNYGVVPAALGLGVDALAPKATGKVAEGVFRGAGAVVKASGADVPSLKLAATRILVPGSAGEVLQRGLKPSVKYGANAADNLEKTLPDALKALPNIESVSDLGKALDSAKDVNYGQYKGRVFSYGPDSPRVQGEAIADAQLASIPHIDAVEKPAGRQATGGRYSAGGIWNKTAEVADNYRREISMSEADTLREEANAKLHAFYEKTGGDRAAALANPEVSRIKAIGDGLRDQMYSRLDSYHNLEPGTVAQGQEQYGRLAEAADIANKREVVFGRHDPVSLSEKFALEGGNPVHTAYNYALQKIVRGLTDSDALVRSAVDRYKNPSGTPLNTAPLPAKIGDAATASAYTLRRLNPFLPVLARAGQEDEAY